MHIKPPYSTSGVSGDFAIMASRRGPLGPRKVVVACVNEQLGDYQVVSDTKEFIARACNSHEGLVKAVQLVLSLYAAQPWSVCLDKEAVEQLVEALGAADAPVPKGVL